MIGVEIGARWLSCGFLHHVFADQPIVHAVASDDHGMEGAAIPIAGGRTALALRSRAHRTASPEAAGIIVDRGGEERSAARLILYRLANGQVQQGFGAEVKAVAGAPGTGEAGDLAIGRIIGEAQPSPGREARRAELVRAIAGEA